MADDRDAEAPDAAAPDAAAVDADPTADDDIGREAPPTMPSRTAYLLAFTAVVIGGLFGGIIGYGLVDVGCTGDCATAKLVATFLGSVVAAGGVGIVAVLVLRAMAEWKRNPNPRPKGPRRS